MSMHHFNIPHPKPADDRQKELNVQRAAGWLDSHIHLYIPGPKFLV